MLLPKSDVFAQCPPPPREFLILRESSVGFCEHFPKRHVGAKSRQHEPAQGNNGQEGSWHAIILRDAIRMGSGQLTLTGVYTKNPVVSVIEMLHQQTTSSRGYRWGRGQEGSEQSRFLKITVATNVKVISEIARTQSGGSWLAGKMI